MRPVPTMLCAIVFAAVALPAPAQQRPMPVMPAPAPVPADPPYALFADLVLAAPVVVDAAIRSVSRIKGAEAAEAGAGRARLYVEADVLALIRGTAALPSRIGYLLDVAVDARGRPPRLKKERVLLFARGVAGNGGQVQLVRGDAQRPWTPAADALTRRIATEAAARAAPPALSGIANAFHTAGTLPGEGETQVFLTTADDRPVSLSVIRRAGEEPRWTVSLTDVVGEGTAPPPRDTLLWYRLACALPPALPGNALAGVDAAAAEIARADYRFVIGALGPCDRGPA